MAGRGGGAGGAGDAGAGQDAGAVAAGDDFDEVEALRFDGGDVGDDAHGAAVAVEVGQGLEGQGEFFVVEGAETFVEEEGVDGEVLAGEAAEGQGEGKGDEEGFAAGEVGDGTAVVGPPVVDGDGEEVGVGGVPVEFVAPGGHGEEGGIGFGEEFAEGDALGVDAEGVAVLAAEPFVEAGPGFVEVAGLEPVAVGGLDGVGLFGEGVGFGTGGALGDVGGGLGGGGFAEEAVEEVEGTRGDGWGGVEEGGAAGG